MKDQSSYSIRWLGLAVLLAGGVMLQLSPRAAAPPTPQGMISGKAFTGIAGTAVVNLTGHAKFPNSPDVVMYLPYFEWNATGDVFSPAPNWADNYGTQIVGYFYPPTTGDYVFYLSADDNAELYLSTDDTAANKKLIARESVWSNAREYFSSGGNSDLTAKDSSQFTGTQWPTTVPGAGAQIRLTAGRAYYIEALAKEGGGGDNLSVSAFDVSGGRMDPNYPISGEFLATDRTAGPASIATHPADQTVPERGAVTFHVTADGTPPYTFQWKKNGADIPNETGLSYTIPSATTADNGARYSVVVTGAQGPAVTSQEAVLTVTPDTVPPVLLGAKGLPNLTEVVLSFSEALAPASITATANYRISSASGPVNVTAATVSPGGTQVTLTTSSLSLGTKYTVLVSGVRDTAATPNTIATDSKAVFFPTGKLAQNAAGFVVFEAENYDRNLDGRWVPDTARGTPSGGVSMVVPNGAGGNESGTQLEYDVVFTQPGTYQVWYRASGNDGNDDSSWLWLDGGRPAERDPANGAAANSASMTGFSGQADFVWRSDSQDGPDPFTIDILTPGPHVIALARREDGSFFDKFVIAPNPTPSPTGFGPPETREGAPGLPTVSLTAPATDSKFAPGANISLTVNAAGQSGLEITRVDYMANGTLIGTTTTAPFSFTWNSVADGIYSIQAVAFDEIGQSTVSAGVIVTVEAQGPKTSARIAWISFHRADDAPSSAAAAVGFTRAPDVAYTDLLKAQGHDVTRILTTGTPDTALLNLFDLVIISRSVGSGDYQDPPETAAWHSIKSPMMILGGYVLRANRLGFTVGNTIPDTTETIKLTINDKAHPIFAGISVDAANTMVNDYAGVLTYNGTLQRGISVNSDPLAGNGVVLATVGTPTDGAFGGSVIAEWQAGDTMANATPDVLGGRRLVFLTGSREQGITAEAAGIYDLFEDGAKMFINAVNYLAGVTPAPPAPTLSLARTAAGLTITFTGTLQSANDVTGPWVNQAGNSPLSVTAGDARKFYRARR